MIKSQSASPFNATNESCAPSLWDDFQRRNLVPFEFEKESKVNGAAGKISNQMAGDDRLPVLLFARERLACVFILGRGIRLPLFDCEEKDRSEEHTSELQSQSNLVCRLLLEKKNK